MSACGFHVGAFLTWRILKALNRQLLFFRSARRNATKLPSSSLFDLYVPTKEEVQMVGSLLILRKSDHSAPSCCHDGLDNEEPSFVFGEIIPSKAYIAIYPLLYVVPNS